MRSAKRVQKWLTRTLLDILVLENCIRQDQSPHRATLGVHSRPYYSQGRGVIERWWQLADAFQAEVEVQEELLTIHELNRIWEAFRTRRYLAERHSELGRTPTQAIAKVVPQPLEPTPSAKTMCRPSSQRLARQRSQLRKDT